MVYKSSLLVLFFIITSGCTTHRVFNLSGCMDGHALISNSNSMDDALVFKKKTMVVGDGIDHPLEISKVFKKSKFNCSLVKKLSIETKYQWKDVLISFIPFVSQKTIAINSVMDGE